MGQIPLPRTVAVIHIQAGARLYGHGSYGQAGKTAHNAHDGHGQYGSCPGRVRGMRRGEGAWGAGEGAPGSYGRNIRSEKIAPVVVVLCYNITHPIFKDWYIDATH